MTVSPALPSGPPTFTTPYQAPVVRAVNGVGSVRRRLGLGSSLLDPDDLMATARQRTGLDDPGPVPLAEPLGRLVDSYERDAALHPAGRALVRRLLVRHLSRRLEVVAAHRRSPDLAHRRIARPIVVVGLPRTGTTLLLNLLAAHGRARPLLAWEAFDPLARAGPASGRRRRLRAYRRQVRLLNRLAPDIRVVHELVVDAPEECLSLLGRSMLSHGYLLGARLGSYERWLLAQPTAVLAGAYRVHRDQLQVLDAQRPAGHWVLKSPAHLVALEALLAEYPDACIVHTHRRLDEVIASSASLVAVGRSVLSRDVEPAALGREMLDQGSRLIDRVLDQRTRIPAARVFDVRYSDLVADPVGTVAAIHDHFGVAADPSLPGRMEAQLRTRPQHRNGVHRYSMTQFGIAAADVDALGAAYHDRFDLTPAPAPRPLP